MNPGCVRSCHVCITSAAGAVRSFFGERRSKLSQPHSANSHGHYARKKEGYDKSRPLQPINHNTQNLSRLPQRGMSDPTLMHSSKVSGVVVTR